jgi:hypothetical protein
MRHTEDSVPFYSMSLISSLCVGLLITYILWHSAMAGCAALSALALMGRTISHVKVCRDGWQGRTEHIEAEMKREEQRRAEQSRAPLHCIQHIDSYSPFLANGQRKGRLQYLLAPLWKSSRNPSARYRNACHCTLLRLVNLLSSPGIASDASNERNAIIGICSHW